jgi:hypothetical protein
MSILRDKHSERNERSQAEVALADMLIHIPFYSKFLKLLRHGEDVLTSVTFPHGL